MNIPELMIILLILVTTFFVITLITRKNFPVNPISPIPRKKLIGGCKGTRFGCCPDRKTSCIDEQCSNCLMDATPI